MYYYIKYYGCDMNRSDAQRVSSILESLKYKQTGVMESADIIVIIACSVRQGAVDRVYGIFRKKKLKKNVIKILTGCVLKEDAQKQQKLFDIIIDITKIKSLQRLIGQKNLYNYKPENVDYLDIKPNHNNNFSALIPISNGCNQFCSYCAVPYTRGIEKNRPVYSILKEIKKLPKSVKQITLLGQTVNSYINPDQKSEIKDFSDLLETVATSRPDTWITFLSSYPTKFDDKLIKIIAKYDNISHHIHIPLQSGSDKILKMMNRKYSSSQFLSIVEKIYKRIPDANITTDIIIGFPKETGKDFKDTLDILKKTKTTLVYSGLYSPRFETLAYKMYNDNVSQNTKRKRDEIMTRFIGKQSLMRNKRYQDKIVKVLITNHNKKDEYLGKMQTYETVKIFNGHDKYIGQIVNVLIDECLEWGLKGKIINDKFPRFATASARRAIANQTQISNDTCLPAGRNNKKNALSKIICIVGPTACGKTKLGVALANKFNGEIISADSRQVYIGMDIGTGKDLCEYGKTPYHLIDIANPKKQVTLSDWQGLAIEKIKELNDKNKVPIIVGGTGLYINSIVDGYILDDEKVNTSLRKKLNSTPLPELQKMLKKIDSDAYNKIDINNSRRIIRAIEIAKNNSSISKPRRKKIFDSLIIGITYERNIINQRIDKRLQDRIENEGMIEEITNLKKSGLSWKRLEDFGLEYKYVAKYLKKELSYDEMITQLETATHQFAKRQMTWFNKRSDITWIKNEKEAEKLIKQFLNK